MAAAGPLAQPIAVPWTHSSGLGCSYTGTSIRNPRSNEKKNSMDNVFGRSTVKFKGFHKIISI